MQYDEVIYAILVNSSDYISNREQAVHGNRHRPATSIWSPLLMKNMALLCKIGAENAHSRVEFDQERELAGHAFDFFFYRFFLAISLAMEDGE